jgi:hypothetical protein
MARLPLPPNTHALAALLRPEDIKEVSADTRLVRVYTAGGAHPQQWNEFRYAGPLKHARFDPHPVSITGKPTVSLAHGVLYFALSARTCIAEVFQQASIVDRRSRYPHLVVFRPARPLRLLDLAGLWPTRAGASQEISAGPKIVTQAWARAIRAAHPDLDGLWYRSSMDSGEPSVCLWDPPSSAVIPPTPDVLLPLNHPGLDLPLARICDELNYTLL